MAKTRPIALLLSTLIALSATAEEREIVDLIPNKPSGWTIGKLFAPITGLFMGGPSYWYGERTLKIDTSPQGASLDLFYVRENIQRRFERAESPILLQLPTRIETGPRDSIEIRAILDGYRLQETLVDVRSRQTHLTIELTSLPNHLESMTFTHLSRRGSLKFLTREVAKFRLQKMSDGFSIVLTETGHSEGALESVRGVSSDNVQSLRAEQLGEDLLVRVQLHDAVHHRPDLRSTQGYDAARDLHQLTIELVPTDGNAAILAESSDALKRVRRSDVSGCALDFDHSMRSQLDSEALSRALAPSSGFIDSHLKSALRRLGELSPDGLIHLVDGSKFRPAIPLDLAAARAQSAEAIGFISLLRAFVAELEPTAQRRNTLRGVIAPELESERFAAIIEIAENHERRCTTPAPASRSSRANPTDSLAASRHPHGSRSSRANTQRRPEAVRHKTSGAL
ncbi:MAG: hypothetical protein JRD03_11255 [Deltaproteobacteria bacterium]|nr:hypothetical protein [Deltaproteobacteria bacterium]